MKLWYKQPAQKWEEALPVGNGRLGAMMCGGTEKETLWLNEDSVWSGKPLDRINPDAARFLPEIRRLIREGKIAEAEELSLMALSGTPNSERAYETAGELYLNFPKAGEIRNYRRELDLEEGVARVSYEAGNVRYTRELIASYPAQALILHLEAQEIDGGRARGACTEEQEADSGAGAGVQEADSGARAEEREADSGAGAGVQEADSRRACAEASGNTGSGPLGFTCRLGRCRNRLDGVRAQKDGIRLWVDGGEGISFLAALTVRQEGGTVSAIGEHLKVENAREATLYFNIVTSFREKDYEEACVKGLAEAAQKGWDGCFACHKEDYRALFGRLKLYLGQDEAKEALPTDERLSALKRGEEDAGLFALYFQYGRYLLLSSSRGDSLPANLQGIWNNSLTPPWDSKFTININTQMNYWVAESGRLPECHLPYFAHLKKVMENGKRTARRMYGCRGSVAHHNTDIYGDTAPQDHYIPASFWVMGEAWMATHIWEHYLYTGDREFLEEYFEVLQECVTFFEDFLIEGEDGTLVTSPSVSPENTYIRENGARGCLCEGATMDVEILRELLEGYIGACRVLRKEDSQARTAQEMLERLPELKIGRYGQLQEWMQDYEEAEPGHRHISHLYGVYPGSSISFEKTPELMGAARTSLERRLSFGGGHTGWSRAWIIGLWAKFRDGEKAYGNFRELLAKSTFPNLMDNHPMGSGFVFQIDGNLGASAALLEMLVQCRDDRILLLPALPSRFQDGTAEGIGLRGGMTLSMEWKGGRVLWAELESGEERTVTVEANEETREAVLQAGKTRLAWESKKEDMKCQ